jgi:tryptophan synthase beta chain
VLFARTEGISPGTGGDARDQGYRRPGAGGQRGGGGEGILFNLCGHGHFDLSAYEQYLAGELVDLEYSEEDIDRAVARIPG